MRTLRLYSWWLMPLSRYSNVIDLFDGRSIKNDPVTCSIGCEDRFQALELARADVSAEATPNDMEVRGIEPLASSMRPKRSTN